MKREMNGIGILGMGNCLPKKIMTNYELETMVDTSNEWIKKRTGILERRISDKNSPSYLMGVEAGRKAIADAGLKAEDIDLIIVSTITPDYMTPSMACTIQSGIGAVSAAAFDINAACSGFVYAVAAAKKFIESGSNKYVLVVSCEALSKVTDWEDRNTCVLFGDAAGAAVLGHVDDGYGVLNTHIGADGEVGHTITLPNLYLNEVDLQNRTHANKQVIWMDGSEVFKFAVRTLEQATLRVLEGTGVDLKDIKLIIPHQANQRIVEGAAKRLGINMETMYTNLDRYGNTSSASIPVALEEASRAKLIQKDDYIVLVGFGGGLTWGSALIKWNK